VIIYCLCINLPFRNLKFTVKHICVCILRDLSLMVKYETFNLCYVGSIPTGLIKIQKNVYLH
jgi:hypothetical protein